MANYRYPLTDKIKIFPSSLRGLRVTTDGTEAIQGPADGKFTSESNIASIVTTIAGKESYIKEIKEGESLKYIIVIHGYRFLLDGELPHEYKYRDSEGIIHTEIWNDVYANILVEKISGRLVDCSAHTTLDYKNASQLYSEDTVYEFRGLFFSKDSQQTTLTNDDYNCYSLHVTRKKEDKNEWELVYDSTQYLDGAHIYGSVDNTKNVTSTINKVLITDIFNVADAEKGITTAEVNNATNVTKKIDQRYIDDSARPAESQDPSIFEDYTDTLTNPTHVKNSTNVTKTIDGRPIDQESAGLGNDCIFETGTNQTHVKNATKVTTNISNQPITSIFESDSSGITTYVKDATNATKWKKSTTLKIASSDGSGEGAQAIIQGGNDDVTIKLPGTIKSDITGKLTGNADTASAWYTARNFTIASGTGTPTSVDGSANVTLNLPSTITADLTGNAESASKLTTDAGTLKYPVYFSDGVPKQCDGTLSNNISGKADTAGTADKLTSSTLGSRGLISQSIYLSSGTATAGQKIIATNSSSPEPSGQLGDIWIIYS